MNLFAISGKWQSLNGFICIHFLIHYQEAILCLTCTSSFLSSSRTIMLLHVFKWFIVQFLKILDKPIKVLMVNVKSWTTVGYINIFVLVQYSHIIKTNYKHFTSDELTLELSSKSFALFLEAVARLKIKLRANRNLVVLQVSRSNDQTFVVNCAKKCRAINSFPFDLLL